MSTHQRRTSSPHCGGEQLPLIVPDSDWHPPAELPDLRAHKIVALDLETQDGGLAAGKGPGWAIRAGHVCGVSAAWPGGSLYAPVRHPETACFPSDAVGRWLRDHAAVGVRFLFHNAHYDVGWMRAEWGIAPSVCHDTQCMAVMLDENQLSYSLDNLTQEEDLPGKDEGLLKEALGAYGYPAKGDRWKENLWRLPARYVGPYAEADAVATLALYERYLPKLEADGVLPAYETEMSLVPCVHEMRWRGVRVDTERAARAAEQLRRQRDEYLAELSRRLGRRASIDDVSRNRWLAEAFDEQGIAYPRTAPTSMFPNGQPSFTAGGLLGWMPKHPHWLPQLVVKAERAHKAARDFLDTFIIRFAHNGRLHANINQYRGEDGGTRTHRFSYSDPPLQQMPKRGAMTDLVRGCFLPEDGERWCRSDMSQQEFRLIVHFAERCGLHGAREAGDKYRSDPNTDYHQLMAETTDLERDDAKAVNFAKAYGAGAKKFAEMSNKSVDEALALMKRVDEEAPFVEGLASEVQRQANKRGWIRLLDGARLHYDAWEPTWREWGEERNYKGDRGIAPCDLVEARERVADEAHPWHGKRLRRAMTRKAGNGLIQGSAARQVKHAMLACWREGLVPLLQVHDELDFSFGSERDGKRAAELMRDAVKLTVPMRADAEWGTSWGDAKHTWNELKEEVER